MALHGRSFVSYARHVGATSRKIFFEYSRPIFPVQYHCMCFYRRGRDGGRSARFKSIIYKNVPHLPPMKTWLNLSE